MTESGTREYLDAKDAARRIAELEAELVKTVDAHLDDAARLAEREAQLRDRDDDYRAILAEDCAPDEKHCSCVPHLRRRIAELEAENARLHDRVEALNKEEGCLSQLHSQAVDAREELCTENARLRPLAEIGGKWVDYWSSLASDDDPAPDADESWLVLHDATAVYLAAKEQDDG